ncbi:helix-turn-helix domain-containing protein [Streptomyces sp. NPDC059499]|uniref:helix-turn-helix domain-containing protein n=1 Tax=Streptomyces sp. NPDC059499 TaxID=3346852 RepID=UPI0036B3B020
MAAHVAVEREARGWSTAELARRVTDAGCPLSQSAVWRIESGEPRRKISVDELIAFGKVFERSIEELLKPVIEGYPKELFEAYLSQWLKDEEEVYQAELSTRMRFGDLAVLMRHYPGVVPHFRELVMEYLDRHQATHLDFQVQVKLRILAKGEGFDWGRRQSLIDKSGLFAYWNSRGMSIDDMREAADEIGMGDELDEYFSAGMVNVWRKGWVGMGSLSLEDGEVVVNGEVSQM